MCNNEILTVRSTSIVVTGSQLTINIPELTLANNQQFRLILCQSIPTAAGVDQVVLATPTATIEMRLRTGNYVRADQLRCRRVYPMQYGTDPVHASMLCLLPESCYGVAFPTGTPAAQAATVSKKV